MAIAIRSEALAASYPGGVSGFLEDYPAKGNGDIMVYQGLGLDFPDVIEELNSVGLTEGRDFVVVDALARAWAIALRRDESPPLDFQVSWLKGRMDDGAVLLRSSRCSEPTALADNTEPAGAGACVLGKS
jgi:hypothetical protein